MQRRFLVFLAAGILFWPAQALATSKELEIGAEAQTLYDSNIFFAPDNPESDLITSVGPTLFYRHEGKRTTFTVDAKPKYLFYNTHDDLSDLNFNIAENIGHSFNRHWSASLTNTNIKDNTSYLTSDLVGSTGRFEYKYYTLSPSVTYDSKSGTVVTGTAVVDKVIYSGPATADSDGQTYTLAASHELRSALSLLGDVSYQTRSFDNNVDVSVILADAGFKYSPTRRLTHTIKLGAESVDQGADSSSEQFYYFYGLTYELSTRTNLTFSTQKQSAIIDSQNNVLDIWQTTLTLIRKLTRRDTLQVTGSYVLADYGSSLDRQDDIYKIEASLDHALNKHVTVRAGYSFEDKESDPSLGYKRHLVYLSLLAKF